MKRKFKRTAKFSNQELKFFKQLNPHMRYSLWEAMEKEQQQAKAAPLNMFNIAVLVCFAGILIIISGVL